MQVFFVWLLLTGFQPKPSACTLFVKSNKQLDVWRFHYRSCYCTLLGSFFLRITTMCRQIGDITHLLSSLSMFWFLYLASADRHTYTHKHTHECGKMRKKCISIWPKMYVRRSFWKELSFLTTFRGLVCDALLTLLCSCFQKSLL